MSITDYSDSKLPKMKCVIIDGDVMTIKPKQKTYAQTRVEPRVIDNVRLAKNNIKPRLSILGMGYVGLVTAACFSELGHKVIGADPDKVKIDTLKQGEVPIVEPGLSEMLKQAKDGNRLSATVDVVDAVLKSDVTLISVGTPSDDHGGCNIRYLQQAAKQVGQALKMKNNYHLVIFRSTVPPKTCRDYLIPLIEMHSGKTRGLGFGVCFNPEFLRESSAIEDFFNPPKTVIGCLDKRSGDYAAKLYQAIPGEPIMCSLEAAEFVKYVDNAWHAVKVSFANEIGRLCKSTGVNSHQVMDIFKQDTKLNISSNYLMPGFAYGGSCLPKDTRGILSLAARNGVDLPLIRSLAETNDRHIGHALELIEQRDPRAVGIIGYSFKAGTDDLRESPSIRLAAALERLGYKVYYYDPNLCTELKQQRLLEAGAKLPGQYCKNSNLLIKYSDLIVVAHQDAYAESIANRAMARKPLLDLMGLSEGNRKNQNYQGLCW